VLPGASCRATSPTTACAWQMPAPLKGWKGLSEEGWCVRVDGRERLGSRRGGRDPVPGWGYLALARFSVHLKPGVSFPSTVKSINCHTQESLLMSE
jgi:hypothetical protein